MTSTIDGEEKPNSDCLFVDREEFIRHFGEIAKMEGMGRMPVSLALADEQLVLTYGCRIRMPAVGAWTGVAEFSKAAIKRFVQEYCVARPAHFMGKPRASHKRFLKDFARSSEQIEIYRDGTAVVIEGFKLPCKWLPNPSS